MNVAVFAGSRVARQDSRDPSFVDTAYHLGKALAIAGHTVVNGGGGGLMEACAKGVIENGGRVHSIRLAMEGFHQSSFFTTEEHFIKLNPRQQRLLELSRAYVALPGGIGTVLEVTEILALRSLSQESGPPLVLVGSGFWREYSAMLRNLVMRDTTPNELLNWFIITDRVSQVIEIINS